MPVSIHSNSKFLGKSIRENKIINVIDHMPHVENINLSIEEKDRFFQNTIIDLFQKHNIDYREKIFIFDSYLCFDDFSIEQSFYTNSWLINNAVDSFLTTLPDWNNVPRRLPTKKLSAMMNKVRPNRLITSMILANLFDPSEICYSFHKDQNSQMALKELFLNTDCKFDLSKLLEEKWAGSTQYNPENIKNSDNFVKNIYHSLFADATISLITEPVFYERGNQLSEKTLMSVYAGHFPIWIGSYKSPECAAKLGLDTFDDIIDHSYQYIEHPGRRSAEAILRNIDLLTNLELQAELKNQMYNRLDDNLKLMRDKNKLTNNMRINFNSHNLDLYDYLINNGYAEMNK